MATDVRTLYQIHTEPIPQSGNVSVDRWLQPLGEPIRLRGLSPSEQQFLAYTGIVAPVVATTIEWLQPFGEPVRRRQFLASEQQALAYTRAIALVDWFQPLALPSRRANALQAFLPPTPTDPAITPSYGWYGAFSVPIFLLSRRALAPEGFYFPPTQPAPAVSVAAWNEWWSEPARLRLGLLAASQSNTVGPIIPIPTPPGPSGQYTVSGLYVIDQFTDNTVVYDYSGGVSHRTN